MEFFNTKTRKKEIFKPLNQNEIKIYYCGPTVYNFAHIGNLRTFVFEDIVVKTLKFLGNNVKTVMNLTDVDDKTIRESQKNNMDLLTFTQKYSKIFLDDINKLGITKADEIVPVTSLMPEMVRMINTMLKRKNAYLSDDGSIYFNVKSFKKYGRFANLDISTLKDGVRIDNDEYEKDKACDFVLWKSWKETDGNNYWEEEFEISNSQNPNDGKQKTSFTKKVIKGRPGWHIECSACNIKYFGAQIDIHMGGVDLIFPHHQNEIAQSESCTRKEFSKYWLHSGHLMVNGKKMSKSLGNFYTLRDLEQKFQNINPSILYRSIRLSFMNAKYSSQVDFNFDKLESNFNTIKNIDETLKLVSREIKSGDKCLVGISKIFSENMQIYLQTYIMHLENDFNIPDALAEFFAFTKYVNTQIRENNLSLEEIKSILDMFKTFNEVLGVFDFNIINKLNKEIPSEILSKLEERNQAKKDKNFELADNLRNQILELGYIIIDEKDGSRIEKK